MNASLAQAGLPNRWNRKSLRARLLVFILLWTTIGIGGVWLSATRLFEKHVEQQYHDELEVHILELASLTRAEPKGGPRLDRPLSDPRYVVPLSGFYWQIEVDGQPAIASPSMSRGSLDGTLARSSEVKHGVRPGPTGPAITYGFAERLPDGRQIHFLIATDKRHLDGAISRFTKEILVWLASFAALLAACGLLIVTLGFRPLDRLGNAISRLRSGASDRLDGSFPTEISPLVEDLNAFIRHNNHVVERGRIEAGNLAHALRTPLAVMIDEAEQLAARPETRDSGHILLHHAQQMARQIQMRTVKARFAAIGGVPGSFSRLKDVLPPILQAMRRLHPGVAFNMVKPLPDDAVLPIDPVDLTELLSNLLDNAGKWAEAEVNVHVGFGDTWQIEIRDDGPGLTADQIAKVFEIGIRLDEEKPGSGLGLAISRDIAQSYGFEIHLEKCQPGLSAIVRPAGEASS